ncbi:MAG TPA: uroporphyrinogen-III synthase [Candidatus Polarisedimenticolia bacterium]
MNPLAGRTVLVTRSRDQASELGGELEGLGARVIEAPVIAFMDPVEWAPVDAAIESLDRYDVVIFTSVNAVDRFARRMEAGGSPVARLSRPRLVAIGPATGAGLLARGLRPDDVAADSSAEGILGLLATRGALAGLRILIPRAAVARDLLPDRLREAGALVDVVAVYRTVPVPVEREVLDLIRDGGVDAITFTSSSTVSYLLAGVGGASTLKGLVIAAIGPVTARSAREAGLNPQIVAESTGMRALALALGDYFAKR